MKNSFTYLIFLIALVFSTFVTLKVDKSYQEQMFVIPYFNNNEWRKEIWGDNINFQTDFPNISATTLPLKSIKANFIRENEGIEQAINYIKKIKSPNPFMGFEEGFLANSYAKMNNFDSAYHYGKIAFSKLPLNTMYSVNFLFAAGNLKKFDEMQKAFNRVKNLNNIYDWQMYLTFLNNERFLPQDSIKSLFKQAYKLFPEDSFFDLNNRFFETDIDLIYESNLIAQKGEELLKEKKYNEALIEYEKASELVPEEYAHKENIVLINFLLKNHLNVIKLVDSLYSSKIAIPENGKLYFYRSVAYFEIKENDKGCFDLLKAIEQGYEIAKNASFLKRKCGF